jgi:pimeloyl-ACP methyl ester carboxylesterase
VTLDDGAMFDPVEPIARGPRRRLLAALVGLVVLAAVIVVVAVVADDDDSPGGRDAQPTPTPTQTTPTDEPDPEPSEPGRLISRSAFTTAVPSTVRAWRIVYSTTDAKGRPDTATATVLASKDRPDGPRPVVGVGHGTVGLASRCAPSLSQQPFTGAVTALATLVSEGWVAVTTDYAGLGTPGMHPFLVGKSEAHNVLDAVRAAHEVLDLSPKTLLMGHSQGGHAALWAGIEAPAYAPKLDVIGVAATAPASDLHDLLTTTRGLIGGTLVEMLVLHAWERIYPEAKLGRQVGSRAASVLDQAGRLCLFGSEGSQLFGLARSVVGETVPESAYDGELGRLLRANTPSTRITAPVLVAQGLADVLVPPGVQEAWVAKQCAAGQEIDYREYDGQTHTSLVLPSSPLIDQLVQWAQDRLAGKPARGNCG